MIIFIFIYHYFIQNGIEKLFCKTFIKDKVIKRPLFIGDSFNNVGHIGLPSGHAEIVTIICCVLYHNKYINLPFCLIIIAIISLQRVVSKRHTFTQIIFGIIFGYIYSLIYIKLPIFGSIITVLFVTLLLLLFISKKIDKHVQQPIPKWVSSSMMPSIHKKQNINIRFKLYPLILNSIYQDTILYVSWEKLENYIDIIISKIKKTKIKYDAVVGIKTGGGILSDYISKKLGLCNYKIKILKPQNKNCIKRCFEKKIFKITEGIDDNLEGKNILLIDEAISSGDTIYFALDYLKSKKPKIVKTYSINYIKKDFNKLKKNNIKFITNDDILIWPWLMIIKLF